MSLNVKAKNNGNSYTLDDYPIGSLFEFEWANWNNFEKNIQIKMKKSFKTNYIF